MYGRSEDFPLSSQFTIKNERKIAGGGGVSSLVHFFIPLKLFIKKL